MTPMLPRVGRKTGQRSTGRGRSDPSHCDCVTAEPACSCSYADVRDPVTRPLTSTDLVATPIGESRGVSFAPTVGQLAELDRARTACARAARTSRPSACAQAAHLALSPFGDRDLELPAPRPSRRASTSLRMHRAVLELHALRALARPRRRRFAEHGRDVRALDLTARMRERVRRRAVRREQQHALR